jgi:hypothetical protein
MKLVAGKQFFQHESSSVPSKLGGTAVIPAETICFSAAVADIAISSKIVNHLRIRVTPLFCL